MKKKFITPELELIKFSKSDVIVTSTEFDEGMFDKNPDNDFDAGILG